MKQHKAQCFICSPYDSKIHSIIESEILRNEFRQESTWGFRIKTRRNNILQAVYVEKLIYSEKVVDPFGNTTEFERVSYNQIEFQLSTFPPNILIFQPPRNYRKLINQLAQFFNYSIAIESKEIKVLDWVDLLTRNGLEGRVTKVDVDQVRYDESTTGKLILIGHHDVRERLYQLLTGTNFSIKNAKISFEKKVSLPDVELFSNGKIIFKYPVPTEDFKYFYDAFFALTEQQKPEQSH